MTGHEMIGGLTIVMGLIAAFVGMVVADHSIHSARRAYRRTTLHSVATVGGWGSWFLSGFSGVTMGVQWLYAVGIWLARAPVVRVDSIVGAGDSFIGGFLTGWIQGRSFADALRWAVAAGAATAITPGTELCYRADVRRLLPRVTVTRIA